MSKIHSTASLLFEGSFVVDHGDHLRSNLGIIYGLGSFAVLYSPVARWAGLFKVRVWSQIRKLKKNFSPLPYPRKWFRTIERKSGLKFKPSNKRALKLIMAFLLPHPPQKKKHSWEEERIFFSSISINGLDSTWDVPFNFWRGTVNLFSQSTLYAEMLFKVWVQTNSICD